MFIKCILVFIFVLLRGMFAAMDTAFVYIDKYKVSKSTKKDRKSEKIQKLIDDRIRFWGITEIGIILAELFLTAYAAEEFTYPLAFKIQSLGFAYDTSVLLAVIALTVILTFALLLFGTILPKQMARNNPEKVAYRYINFVWLFSKINHPFEWFVRKVAKIFSKIYGIEEDPESKLTEKQIKMIIAEGQKQGALEGLEKQIAIKGLDFDDIEIKNIMIKKEDVNFLNIDSDSKAILENINTYKYTRIPIYKENIVKKENIIGIFNIKDLIVEYSKNKRMNINIVKHIRPIEFVDKNEKISEVFKKLQKHKASMAIVIDEKDIVYGIVTMEDILEMLVGKIFDEYEKSK